MARARSTSVPPSGAPCAPHAAHVHAARLSPQRVVAVPRPVHRAPFTAFCRVRCLISATRVVSVRSLWVAPHFSANINKLSADFEAAKKAAETRDLMEDAKKRKKNKGKDIEPVKESDEVMQFLLPCLCVLRCYMSPNQDRSPKPLGGKHLGARMQTGSQRRLSEKERKLLPLVWDGEGGERGERGGGGGLECVFVVTLRHCSGREIQQSSARVRMTHAHTHKSQTHKHACMHESAPSWRVHVCSLWIWCAEI